MKIYMAPMEGITIYTYRNAYKDFFGHVDKYFTPFIAAEGSRKMKKREVKDILPENNQGIPLVPQIISNNAENFVRFAKLIYDKGYKEINFNLGCPSGTVVAKHKGSGFLGKLTELDRFFDYVFNELTFMDISVKTRIGLNCEDEISELMKIYNRYPIHELIVHPRIRKDYYQHEVRMDKFRYVYETSTNPVCYNGNIYTYDDYKNIADEFKNLKAVMLGRGLIRNPGLCGALKEGQDMIPYRDVLRAFHDRLYAEYKDTMPDARVIIYKMKEIWVYMIDLFEDDGTYIKLFKKSDTLSQYNVFVNRIFSECKLRSR